MFELILCGLFVDSATCERVLFFTLAVAFELERVAAAMEDLVVGGGFRFVTHCGMMVVR